MLVGLHHYDLFLLVADACNHSSLSCSEVDSNTSGAGSDAVGLVAIVQQQSHVVESMLLSDPYTAFNSMLILWSKLSFSASKLSVRIIRLFLCRGQKSRIRPGRGHAQAFYAAACGGTNCYPC